MPWRSLSLRICLTTFSHTLPPIFSVPIHIQVRRAFYHFVFLLSKGEHLDTEIMAFLAEHMILSLGQSNPAGWLANRVVEGSLYSSWSAGFM